MIKIKVLAYGFLYPVILVLLLAFIGDKLNLVSSKILSVATLSGILFVILFKRFFSDEKFLLDAKIENGKLVLTHLNSLAEKDQLLIKPETLIDTRINKRRLGLYDFRRITFISLKKELIFNVFETDSTTIEQTIILFRQQYSQQ